MGIEEKAKQFATKAHASIDQRKKYTNEPYINHPAAVVEIVRSVPHTPEMLAAAWLHDVVEDTPVTIREIRKVFGDPIHEYVYWLTDKSKPEDGNRATRKEIDRRNLSFAPESVKTIKLADLIDNSKSIVTCDPKFAKVYLAEKRLLLEVLKGGDETLWQRAHSIAYT